MKAPSERQRWARYFRKLADILALKDWTVKIDESRPSNDDAIAAVYACHGRKIATIYLSDGFLGESPEKQRLTAVHELIHAHFAPYVKAVEIETGEDKVLGLLMEYAVDGIADAVAPLVPLPPAKR